MSNETEQTPDKLKADIEVHDRTIENHSVIVAETDKEITAQRELLRTLIDKRTTSRQNIKRAVAGKKVAQNQLDKMTQNTPAEAVNSGVNPEKAEK